MAQLPGSTVGDFEDFYRDERRVHWLLQRILEESCIPRSLRIMGPIHRSSNALRHRRIDDAGLD